MTTSPKLKKDNSVLFKGTSNIQKFTLIAKDKMKSMFYKIKCTAASDQVLNCQPKIVLLNNICHSVTSKLILFPTNFIPSFRYSGPVDSWLPTGSGPVNFWNFF